MTTDLTSIDEAARGAEQATRPEGKGGREGSRARGQPIEEKKGGKLPAQKVENEAVWPERGRRARERPYGHDRVWDP